LCYFYVICVFCHLVVLVRLSVPQQVIDWKDLSQIPCVDGDIKPYSLACSLTVLDDGYAMTMTDELI